MSSIVISCNSYWYAFNFRKSTIAHFIRLGFDVTVVAPYEKNYREKIKNLGASVSDIKLSQSSTNPIREIISLISIFVTYKKLSPTVILHFTPKNNLYGTLAASWLKIPCINNISGRGKVFSNTGFMTKLITFLYRAILKKSYYIFFQNEEDMQFFKDLGVTSPKHFSLISGSGVDLAHFKYSELPNDSKIKILMFGRLISEKGVNEFLSAAKFYYEKDVIFTLAGFVDQHDKLLLSKIQRSISNGYIEYLDPTDNVVPIIENSHCVVLPSYYSEGIPKSLIESLAIGRPIITTNNIGCKEAINGKNGFLIEPRSSESLINAIGMFLSLDRDEMNLMGRMSRNYAVSRFDENNILCAYDNVVQGALKIVSGNHTE